LDLDKRGHPDDARGFFRDLYFPLVSGKRPCGQDVVRCGDALKAGSESPEPNGGFSGGAPPSKNFLSFPANFPNPLVTLGK